MLHLSAFSYICKMHVCCWGTSASGRLCLSSHVLLVELLLIEDISDKKKSLALVKSWWRENNQGGLFLSFSDFLPVHWLDWQNNQSEWFLSLMGWFKMLSRLKSHRQGLTRAKGAGYKAKTRATDTHWHSLMLPAVSQMCQANKVWCYTQKAHYWVDQSAR